MVESTGMEVDETASGMQFEETKVTPEELEASNRA